MFVQERYMKIHVYSTLAKLVVVEEKTQTQYTTPEQYKHINRTLGYPALRMMMG